jgi:hypothetical protein
MIYIELEPNTNRIVNLYQNRIEAPIAGNPNNLIYEVEILPSGFTHLIEGMYFDTVKKEICHSQLSLNIASKLYLASTDWYAIRYAETGKPIPVDIAEKRQQARNNIVVSSN